MRKMRSLVLSCCLLFGSYQHAQADCYGAMILGVGFYTLTAIPAFLYGIIALPISQSDRAMEPRCGDKDPYSFCCDLTLNNSEVEPTNCAPQIGNRPQCADERHPFCAVNGNVSDLFIATSQKKTWKDSLTISSGVCLAYGGLWFLLPIGYGGYYLAEKF